MSCSFSSGRRPRWPQTRNQITSTGAAASVAWVKVNSNCRSPPRGPGNATTVGGASPPCATTSKAAAARPEPAATRSPSRLPTRSTPGPFARSRGRFGERQRMVPADGRTHHHRASKPGRCCLQPNRRPAEVHRRAQPRHSFQRAPLTCDTSPFSDDATGDGYEVLSLSAGPLDGPSLVPERSWKNFARTANPRRKTGMPPARCRR